MSRLHLGSGQNFAISKWGITEYYTIYIDLNFGSDCLGTKQLSKPFQDSVFSSLLAITLYFCSESIFLYLFTCSPYNISTTNVSIWDRNVLCSITDFFPVVKYFVLWTQFFSSQAKREENNWWLGNSYFIHTALGSLRAQILSESMRVNYCIQLSDTLWYFFCFVLKILQQHEIYHSISSKSIQYFLLFQSYFKCDVWPNLQYWYSKYKLFLFLKKHTQGKLSICV